MKREFVIGLTLLGSITLHGQTVFVIGGTSSDAPPGFQSNNFWAMTAGLDRAFSFKVPDGGPFLVQEAEVPVWHYSGSSGDQALFSINADNAGSPGASLVTFALTGISTTPQVMTASAQGILTLQSDSTYWFTGTTPYGQVNWCLTDGVLSGTAAYQVNDSGWTILGIRQNSAFDILGSPVPEPSTLALLAITAGTFGVYRRYAKT